MFDKWRKYSYAAQKTRRHRLLRVAFWFLAFYILYNALTSLVFSVRVLDNSTMQPTLNAGDRFIFSSRTLYSLLPDPGPVNSFSLRRGNIVLVDTDLGENRGLFVRLADQGLRFFTAQRKSLRDDEEHFYVKRIIGIPGDEVSMTNFVFRVRARDSLYAFTEFEHSDRDYKPAIPQIPALWDESLPFSGTMDKLLLGPDEYFLVSDDRSNTNDSRTWGPVPEKLIMGKLIFRFWPVTHLGSP